MCWLCLDLKVLHVTCSIPEITFCSIHFSIRHVFLSFHFLSDPLEHLLLMRIVWADMFFFCLLHAKNVLSLVTAFVLFCRPAWVTCHTTNTLSEICISVQNNQTSLHYSKKLHWEIGYQCPGWSPFPLLPGSVSVNKFSLLATPKDFW